MVDARVEEFRDQARRRLEGKLTEDQFKPLRLMNGLYLQLHAYMLRVAIPYGTLDSRQMHALADIADIVSLTSLDTSFRYRVCKPNHREMYKRTRLPRP